MEVVELQISELLEKQTKLTSRKNKLLKILEGACSSAQPSGSSKAPKLSFSKQDLQHYEESGIAHFQINYLFWCFSQYALSQSSCKLKVTVAKKNLGRIYLI